MLDGEERVHSANPAFAALVGRNEAELRGRPFAEIVPGVDLPAGPADPSGEEQTVEARFENALGEERDVRVSVSAFQGAPERKVVLVDDVTDRVRAERALAERERLASLGCSRPASRTRSTRRSPGSPPTRRCSSPTPPRATRGMRS